MKDRMFKMSLIGAMLVVAACKGKADGDNLGVGARVDLYCSDFAHFLEHAADEYEQMAPALDGGQQTPEQRNRTAILFAGDGIGLSSGVRMTRMQDFYKTFLFCITVRQVDQHREDEIEQRLGKLNQTLSEQDLDGAGFPAPMSHADAAKQLRELATLAREVSGLPRRD